MVSFCPWCFLNLYTCYWVRIYCAHMTGVFLSLKYVHGEKNLGLNEMLFVLCCKHQSDRKKLAMDIVDQRFDNGFTRLQRQ